MGEMNISPMGDMNISPTRGRHKHLSHRIGGRHEHFSSELENCFTLLLKTQDQRNELDTLFETIKGDNRDEGNNLGNRPN